MALRVLSDGSLFGAVLDSGVMLVWERRSAEPALLPADVAEGDDHAQAVDSKPGGTMRTMRHGIAKAGVHEGLQLRYSEAAGIPLRISTPRRLGAW